MKRDHALRYVLMGFFAMLWLGGVASYLWLGGPPPGQEWSAPVFLATAGALALLLAPPRDRRVLLAAGVLGFLSEVAGVHTGIPFGGYHYTRTLAPLVFGVPLVLAAAWLVLFAYVRELLVRMGLTRVPAAVIGAAWMTAIDLVIDPLAAGPLGFWVWTDTGPFFGIPTVNFAGWFAVSFALFLALPAATSRSTGLGRLGLAIVLFFTAIALDRPNLLPVAVIGIGLLVAHAIVTVTAPRADPVPEVPA